MPDARIQLRPASADLTNALVAITGPAGSGKTYGALLLAHGLGKKIVVIDTELRPNRGGVVRGRSETYNGRPALDGSGVRFQFDVITLERHSIEAYTEALQLAWRSGAEVVVVDSLTHEWTALLNRVDQLKRGVKNQLQPWQMVTPEHAQFIQSIVSAPSHMVCTIRSKMTTAEVEENGKKTFKKVGYQPIQRDGVEYEFEVILDVDFDHHAYVVKANAGYSRELTEELTTDSRITVALGRKLRAWLDGPAGAAGAAPVPPTVRFPDSVAAKLGLEPGSFALAPDPGATPIADPDTGEFEGWEPPVEEATPPEEGRVRLTRDEVLAVLGEHHGREADALLEGEPAEARSKLSPAIFNILAARFSQQLVVERWRAFGGFKKTGDVEQRRALTWGGLRDLVTEFVVRQRARVAAEHKAEASGAPAGEASHGSA